MIKHIAIAAALILASSAGFAAQPGSFYAGGDVGRTKVTDVDGHDTSFGAFAGYNFHPNFAVELGHRRLYERDYRFGTASADFRANRTSLSLIGSLPVGEGFSVYGRLGLNRLESKISSNGFNAKDSTTKALYGVGMRYAFTPAVSARLEVQKPASDATNLSAGVSFQF